jgi:hypothetical protein
MIGPLLDEIERSEILKHASLRLNSDSPCVRCVAFHNLFGLHNSVFSDKSDILWNEYHERNFIRGIQKFHTSVQRHLWAIRFPPVSPIGYFEDLLLQLKLS